MKNITFLSLLVLPIFLLANKTLQKDTENAHKNFLSPTCFGQSCATSMDTITSLHIKLDMRTDLHPEENYWEITNESGVVIFDRGNAAVIGKKAHPFTLGRDSYESWEMSLPEDGTYSFKIYDSGGNGICCSGVEGYYTMMIGRDTMFSGGDFGSGIEHQFEVNTGGDVSRNRIRITDYNWSSNLICEDTYIEPEITIQNISRNKIRSFVLTIENEDRVLDRVLWSGELESLETITLTQIQPITVRPGSLLFVFTVEINNEPNDANFQDYIINEFNAPPNTREQSLILEAQLGKNAHEIYWELINASNDVIASGGNIKVLQSGGGQSVSSPSDSGAYAANAYLDEEILIPRAQMCYDLKFYDDGGDGIQDKNVNGYFYLRDEQGNSIYDSTSLSYSYNYADFIFEKIDLSITTREKGLNRLAIHPNPAQDYITILNQKPSGKIIKARLTDLLGRSKALSKAVSSLDEKHIQIDVSHLDNGSYLIIIDDETKRMVGKFIIAK